jgi:hypothetical protein
MHRQYALNGETKVSRSRLIAVTFLGLIVAVAAVAQTPGKDAARAAVETFGRGLTGGDPSLVRPLLPDKGKVQLNLVRLGPERGSFSASQVEALLRDFLAQGSVQSFETTRVEHDPNGVALASARLDLTDKEGRDATVDLHLTFQPNGQQWVLREIRETPR